MDDHRLLEEASEELADEPSTAAGLRATAEQLQVVEEELHQQNEELAAAREALESERNRYQELFECAPDGYLITDPEGMIGEANRAAAVLLGMEPGLLVGKPLANFLPKEECRAFRTKLSQLRQASRLQVWGVSLQPCRGAPFDAALTVATVRDAEQRLQGLRWLIREHQIDAIVLFGQSRLSLLFPLDIHSGEGVFHVHQVTDLSHQAARWCLVGLPTNGKVVEFRYPFKDFTALSETALT